MDDFVYVKNFHSGAKWLSGQVMKVGGPRTYLIKLDMGPIVRRHVDHMRARSVPSDDPQDDDVILLPQAETQDDTDISPQGSMAPAQDSDVRRSTRIRQPPERYTPSFN